MTAGRLELALRKQRLQLTSARLRQEFAADAAAFEPVFGIADRIRDGAAWLRRHPEVAFGAGIAVLVAKPRALLRWGQRGLVGWQVLRRARRWLDDRLTQP